MTEIDGTTITETSTEFGVRSADGTETFEFPDLDEQDIRAIAWGTEGAELIKRTVYYGAGERVYE